jgi:hypothetical protein
MNPIIKKLLLTFISTLSIGCTNRTGVLSDEVCQNNVSKANSYLNEYYIDGNEKNLKFSLSIIDSIFNSCPGNNSQLVSLKITLLLLLRDYDGGFEFVKYLEENGFDKPYKRNMYLNTFKALSFEAKGDTIQRNFTFKYIAEEIEGYIKKNPTDKGAITDLYFTKIRFTSKETLIEEIDNMKENEHAGEDFYIALKESIKFAPKM